MLKFQAVAEKTAKNFRGLLFFATPCKYTTQRKYVASVSGSACELGWQRWKARGDYFHK